MENVAGIWIDHQKAVIVTLTDGTEKVLHKIKTTKGIINCLDNLVLVKSYMVMNKS